jgi:hypothetical protein
MSSACKRCSTRETLDFFHDHLLRHTGARPWPHRICLPGNDGGSRNIALISRLPLEDVTSHAALMPADLGLAGHPGARPGRPSSAATAFWSARRRHALRLPFQGPWPEPETAWQQRRLEALAVRRLIEAQFGNDPDALWLILGDLNEPAVDTQPERAIAPLLGDFTVDLVARMPQPDRWTWLAPDGQTYARPDALLASPALAARWPKARPHALREGLGEEARRHDGPRLPDVGHHRPHASDHALCCSTCPAREGLENIAVKAGQD